MDSNKQDKVNVMEEAILRYVDFIFYITYEK